MSSKSLLAAFIVIGLTFGMKINAANNMPECVYKLELIGKDEVYLDDFKVTVTNQTERAIEIQHLAGPPFKLIYIHENKEYPLIHKEDWYDTMRGASRPSNRRLIPAHLSTSFRVDLKGDYVVVKNGRAVPFRDFALRKSGVIVLIPTDERLTPIKSSQQRIRCEGTSVVWKHSEEMRSWK